MDNNNDSNNNNNKNRILTFLALLLLVLLSMSFFNSIIKSATDPVHITYTDFMDLARANAIESIKLKDTRILIYPKTEFIKNDKYKSKSFFTTNIGDRRLYEIMDRYGIDVDGEVIDPTEQLIGKVISLLLPLVLLYALFLLMMKRMNRSNGLFGVGKNNAKTYVQKDTGITFKDVAGEDEAKESLQEVVDFLHNPMKYTGIGAKLPKGVLLVGPPGTGKTLLAKAVAGEAHVPFYSLSGSSFVEMFVGVGASRVRDLFEEAKKNAPCIIFIDEIDAVGKSRDSRYGGNDEREQTLNQLLAEMDGFDSSKGLLILAATNIPEVLDPALLRPGRFDRRVIVDKPDLKGREAILRVHANNVKIDDTVNFEEIALATSGAVGSDLANMVNEAAILAVKDRRQFVAQKDLFAAVELVLVGKEKKNKILSRKERRIVSYHEVGHALTAALQKNSEPVQKITIVPRTMGALGYVMTVPEEEKFLSSKEELHDMMVCTLAGRAAEEIVFNSITTGASNDIEKATSVAKSMVTRYGMSDRFGLMGLASVDHQYLQNRANLECSDVTAAAVDEEVNKILKECYQEAKDILNANREALDKIAEHLIKYETITGKEFMKLLHEVQGVSDDTDNSKCNDNKDEEQEVNTQGSEEVKQQEDTSEAQENNKMENIASNYDSANA